MKRGLFLQVDVSAGTAWDPFRRELPPSPKTKKAALAGGLLVSPCSSSCGGRCVHAPNHDVPADAKHGPLED